jgi:fibronectin-binding autotransporter adhesin
MKSTISVFFGVCVALTASAQIYIDEEFDYSNGPLGSPWSVANATNGSTVDVAAASTFLGYTPEGKQLTITRVSGGGAPLVTLSTGTASPVTSPWSITQGADVKLTFDLFVGDFTTGGNAEFRLLGGSATNASFFSLRTLGTSATSGKFQVRTTGASDSYVDLLESGSPVTLAENTWFRVNYSSIIGPTNVAGTNGRQFYNLSIEKLGTGGGAVYSGTSLTLDPTLPIGGTGAFSIATTGFGSYSVADIYLIPGSGDYWAPTSSGGEGVWSSGNENWATVPGVAGTVPQATNDQTLIFAGTGAVVEVSGTVSATAGLTFSNNGYVLTNGTVSLAGTNAAANTITTDAGVSTTVNSVLAGSQGMTKAGSGTLVLSGANTYSGATLLNSGTLRLEHVDAAGSGTITQSNASSTLQINTTGTVANAMSIYDVQTLQTVTLSGNKTLNNSTYSVADGTTTTESGVLSGGGGITKLGTGTLLVTASNTFTGTVDVQAGLLSLASATGSAAGGTTNVIVATNATLLIAQSNQVNNDAAVSLSGGTIQRATGVSEVFGNLNVSSASFLDFGSGTEGTLSFGTYTSSALLTVNNFFEGNVLTFRTDLSGSINNTNSFKFDNAFASSWNQGTSTFTITAIPEASTCAAALLLLALLLWPLRRGLVAGRTSHPHSA